ncbi:MAG: NUDIX domain-containing protein [Patescibacteria group bacterium]|nr:NUDIX domain-containing protein [Patescibacteria group bacterium]
MPSSTSKTHKKYWKRPSKPQPAPSSKPAKSLGNVKGQRYIRQESAGGVIYRRKGNHTEILFLKREDGKWTFPKGKRQLGESNVVAAIREIREETGIATLRYVGHLGHTKFKFTERHKGPAQNIDKTVHFFLFEAPPGSRFDLPGTEGITQGAWVPTEKAFATLSYRNMDRLLAKALRLIVEEEKKRPKI